MANVGKLNKNDRLQIHVQIPSVLGHGPGSKPQTRTTIKKIYIHIYTYICIPIQYCVNKSRLENPTRSNIPGKQRAQTAGWWLASSSIVRYTEPPYDCESWLKPVYNEVLTWLILSDSHTSQSIQLPRASEIRLEQVGAQGPKWTAHAGGMPWFCFCSSSRRSCQRQSFPGQKKAEPKPKMREEQIQRGGIAEFSA